MAVSYNKLFKLLIDKKMKKKEQLHEQEVRQEEENRQNSR